MSTVLISRCLRLVLLAACATVLLWPPLVLATPPPLMPAAAQQASAHHPPAPISTIFLPVSVPIALIGERLNSLVPASFSGNERNPVRHNSVVDDTLAWAAHRGPVFVWGDHGRLRLAVAAVGNADVRGRVRALRGTVGKILRRATGGASDVPFSARADIHATLEAAIRPQLRPDWHIDPQIAARVGVHRAEVPIAGITSVSVRGNVWSTLNRKVQALLDRMQQDVRQDNRLRRLASREWERMHKVEKIWDDPPTWLLVRPIGVAASPIEIDQQEIRFGLGIAAETSMVVADDAPLNPAGPLPPLEVARKQTGGINLHIPAHVSWGQLSGVLGDKLPRQIAIGGGAVLKIRNVEIVPRDDAVLLSFDLEADTGGLHKVSGKLGLTARPRLDDRGQSLHLDDLDFALEDRDGAASTTLHLIKPALLEILRRHAAIDLSITIQQAREKAGHALAKFVADTPKGVELTAGIKEVTIGDLRIMPGNVQLTVGVSAELKAAISRLPF